MKHDGVTFDEDALMEVLSKKPEPPDDTYVREFMYPGIRVGKVNS
jgi:hypothetical protein